jgi:hypothetical protein
MKSIFLITFFAVALLFSNCKYEHEFVYHYPLLPYTIFPTDEKLSIGDTIWIEGRFSSELTDWKTNEIKNYSGVDLSTYYSFQKLIDTVNEPFLTDANDEFGRKSTIGSFNNQKIEYIESNDSFHFRAFFIARNKGFYFLGLLFIPNYNSSLYSESQIIYKWNTDYVHFLEDAPAYINNGLSTKYRAENKGYKFFYAPTPNKLKEWGYDHRFHYFEVK